MRNKTIIIAEAGVNHNGCIKKAKDLVKSAADTGADYVKFQTFITENLVTEFAEKADYQKQNLKNEDSHFQMLKKLELPLNFYDELISIANEEGIKFLTTSFDIESSNFVNSLDLDYFKIPSGEITNIPYLKHIASFNKKVILSTGMSNLGEIEIAISTLLDNGIDRKKITLLHCTSSYPAPIEDINLLAINTLKNSFKLNVGYSDHSLGLSIPIAAVALGASIIEKHFTLDTNLPGPDHKASLEPQKFKKMVRAIRKVEIGLGNGLKTKTNSEIKNMQVSRKSIVAKVKINKGEIFSEDNLSFKRPGIGLSPTFYEKIVGLKAKKSFEKDDLIEL